MSEAKSRKRRKITPIQKVLVANRGEIAIRVIRACSELGIKTVAIYSEEDYLSLHRIKADEAFQVGKGKGPVEAYLDIEGIIALARENDVDAIHPGYGFMSENEDFATACYEAGIIFIGPTPDAIKKMGNKSEARNIAISNDVPVIPGTDEPITSVETCLEFASKAGYPVLIKSAYGGGGRGVRVCYDDKSLRTNFEEAKSEAKAAFGNDALLVEKYLENPKHIEVQILGDKYGSVMHLFERDCSVQRRYQKVVEMAPAIKVSQDIKQEMYEAAVKVSSAVNYLGAGTVEFLLDQVGNFYFIEMNTRIQVEHTVTEQVTGVDLVNAQIRLAEGYRLRDEEVGIPRGRKLRINGCSIQCRLTTEDPKNNFRPDIGYISAYRSPGGFGIRLDAASAYVGAAITPYYDSMLVKLTTWAPEFEQCVKKMLRALKEFRIRGVKTNIPFLINLVSHPVFMKGECRTTFLDTHREVFEIVEPQDSTSKMLGFIADVTVNRPVPRPAEWETNPPYIPRVPEVEAKEVPLPEHVKIFRDKGSEALSRWILKQKKALVMDTTFRDAHQSLLATRMRTHDMLRIARATAHIGKDIFSYEMWGGATFDVCMRFLHESPWERLQYLREEMPNSLFQMLLRGSNAVGYKNYPDNVVREFVIKAAENGIDIFRIFDCFNWIPNMKVSIETALETGKVVEGAICYTGDITDPAREKYDLDYFINTARELADMGVHIIAIKDMAGLCKPYAAELLVKAIKAETGLPLHFHTHATSGNGEATVMKAVEAGADIVDVAISSLSGTTAQPSLNAVVAALEGHKRATGLDTKKLNELSSYWEDVRRYYAPFETDMKASNADVYIYEIPGGQYTNLRSQAKSLGMGEKWEEIKKAYEQVNKLFGDIIKVTPSSKVVGDMAIFMVQNNLTSEDVVNRGHELAFPQSAVDMMKGELGQTPGGFPKEVKDAILKGEESIEVRPGELIPEVDLKEEQKKLSEKLDEQISDTDLLSYLLYPNVFMDYYKHRKEFGNVTFLPTETFFFGAETGEEVKVTNEEGRSYLIKLFGIGEPEKDGIVPLLFELNGHPRPVRIRDKSVTVDADQRQKADPDNPSHVGSPLAGKVMKLFVKEGDEVVNDEPLFVIEAMKMQTNIKASADGKVKQVIIKEGENVEAGDLVILLESD